MLVLAAAAGSVVFPGMALSLPPPPPIVDRAFTALPAAVTEGRRDTPLFDERRSVGRSAGRSPIYTEPADSTRRCPLGDDGLKALKRRDSQSQVQPGQSPVSSLYDSSGHSSGTRVPPPALSRHSPRSAALSLSPSISRRRLTTGGTREREREAERTCARQTPPRKRAGRREGGSGRRAERVDLPR